jgi:hypothetical protein
MRTAPKVKGRHSEPELKVKKDVIPNRAESPVRNLLFSRTQAHALKA